MTQHIGIAHRGASGADPLTRRAALEDKHQDEGFGVRALAVLFIGFAVYLKTFFTASQAEDTGAVQDQTGTDVPAQTETAGVPAPAVPNISEPVASAGNADGMAEVPQMAAEAAGDLPMLVALTLPPTPARQEQGTALNNPGTGNILSDPVAPDAAGIAPGEMQQAGTTSARAGLSLPSAGDATIAGDAVQNPQQSPEVGTERTPPAAPQAYDIAALFQDLGVVLQDRPDSTVDRVTDLAIGDLMRDVTLDEFRAHLGQIPQDPGRPLDRVISVLNDEGSREAFLARTGLTQDLTLDASYRTNGFASHHDLSGAGTETGPDLFL